MADVAVVDAGTITVKIGDGGGPEGFTHRCMINTGRSLQYSAAESTAEVGDCASPSTPAYIARLIKSTDLVVSGAGKYDAASAYFFLSWLRSGAAKNVKVGQSNSGANGGWTESLPMVLTDFQPGGEARDFADATMTLKQSGKPTLAQNA